MINKNLKDNFAWLNDRPLFVSMSGGKDSTALALHLKSHKIKFTPVFLDTGWEHQATYDYISDILEPMFGKFTVLRNEKLFSDDAEWKGGMEQAIRDNKMFPSGVAKFCTRLLKVVPIQNFYAEIRSSLGKKPINAIGIRAEESRNRSQMSEFEEQDEATVWRPLIKWTQDDVIAIHSKNSVTPNPLYLKGASRVGCYPCIFARKHEIRYIALADPDRIDYIDSLEKRVNDLRGEERRSATFFKSRALDKTPMFIRDIVAWSRNARGISYELDDQEELEEEGCMRWGLCEPRQYPLELNTDKNKRGTK